MLGASWWALPLAPVQVAVAIFTRMHDTVPSLQDHAEPLPYYHHSESAPLTGRGAMTPVEGSDVELGDIGAMPSDPESLKLALAGVRSIGAGATSPAAAPGTSSLSFHFSRDQVPMRTSAATSGLSGTAVAAVLARESVACVANGNGAPLGAAGIGL